MKRTVRIIPVILCLSFLLSMLPFPALADDAPSASGVIRYNVLILDASGSMYGTPAAKQREAAKMFCEAVLASEGENYVAVVRLTTDSYVGLEFTNQLESLLSYINSTPADSGTNINQALEVAGELLEQVDAAGAIKNIVLCSDGLPQSGSYTQSGPYTSSDYYDYDYANYVYNTASSMKESYYLYTLGFFHSLSGSDLTFARRFMSDIQNAGYYEVTDPDDLEFEFGKIAEHITNGDVITSQFKWGGGLKKDSDQVGTCYFSDDYFLENSSDTKNSKYYPHLRTMSLAFELSSWSSKESDVWTTDPAAESAKWQNARNLLFGIPGDSDYPGLGFDEGSFMVSESWSEKPTKDSIGVVAAKKTLYDGSTLVAMAIRGGGYEQEWAGNFTIGRTDDHDGFAEAKKNTLKFLDDYLTEKKITGPIKLWIVGYSRAGVTANMVGGELDSGYTLKNGATVAFDDLFVYAFEPPQGAMKDKTSSGNYSNIHNIINRNDIVPLVAPSVWDFRRYNSDFWIPNEASTSRFGEYKDAMLKTLNGFDGMDNAYLYYKIQESVPQTRIQINWTKILPGGDPFIETIEYTVSTNYAIDTTFDFLADGVIGSRQIYYADWQAGVREILSLVYGGDISDLAKDGPGIDQFVDNFFKELTFDRICEIISPAFSLNPFYGIDARKADIKANISAFVADVLADSDLWGTVHWAAGLQDALSDMLWRFIESSVEDLLLHNATSISSAGNLIGLMISGGLIQAHYSEVTLAWMMSLDSYYGGANAASSNQSSRIIHINCPVDVTVYDGNDNVVAQIIDGEGQTNTGYTVPAFVNVDGEKIVMLPADEQYRIDIIASENGSVNVSFDEYYFSTASVNRLQNYCDIPVSAGEKLTAIVPALSESDATAVLPTGSTADYRLLDQNNEVLTPDDDLRGASAQTTYEVTLSMEGENGIVEGGGTYVVGNFAQVQVFPMNGTEFLGWYDGGLLVSKDEVYRFAVTRDVELTAKFGEAETHTVTFKTTGGGTVENSTVKVSAGTQINVVAVADSGCTFSTWRADAGAFENAAADNTWFTAPDQDVEITAVFNRGNTGGSRSSAAYYDVRVIDSENGQVSVNIRQAAAGTRVTFAATPDDGFKVDTLSVKTSQGSSVNYSAKDNGSYEFTMPKADTTIEARFIKEGDPAAEHRDQCPSLGFHDIDVSMWYHEAVDYVLQNGFMNGMGAGRFEPERNLSRAMLVQILFNMEGKPKADGAITFRDVIPGSWYEDAVRWAAENHIVNGYDLNTFGPDDNITREQLAAIMYRYSEYKGKDMTKRDALTSFTDSDQIADWAKESVEWAVAGHIINGKGNGTLDPGGNATRAEVAQIINNFFSQE